jgi:cobalt-precorrin 5A hydrolase
MKSEKIAIIAFKRDEEKARRIQQYLNADVLWYSEAVFEKALSYRGVVAIMATGIAVRGVAPFLEDKWTDTPVVVVDSSLTFAIPLVGGHHGANEIALKLKHLGLIPVLTTATEAYGKPSVEGIARQLNARIVNKNSTKQVNLALLKERAIAVYLRGPRIVLVDEDVSVIEKKELAGKFIIGIGAHRNIDKDKVIAAIRSILEREDISLDDVAFFATAELKKDEAGIIAAAEHFNKPLIHVPHDVINTVKPPSASKAARLGLVGVCEPAALAVSFEQTIVVPKQNFGDVTIAIAK